MEGLDVRMNMDLAPWIDIKAGEARTGKLERIGLLPNGTAGGKPSVGMLIRLADGTPVIAETTWELFDAAARAFAVTPHNPERRA